SVGRDDPRPGAVREWVARRTSGRPVCEALPTAGPLERVVRHGRLRPGLGGQTLPPQLVHVLEADRGAADAGRVRHLRPRNLLGARDADEYADPGADAPQ